MVEPLSNQCLKKKFDLWSGSHAINFLTLENPVARGPDCWSNFSFSPPAHLCAVKRCASLWATTCIGFFDTICCFFLHIHITLCLLDLWLWHFLLSVLSRIWYQAFIHICFCLKFHRERTYCSSRLPLDLRVFSECPAFYCAFIFLYYYVCWHSNDRYFS